jgi:hypothetical protein
MVKLSTILAAAAAAVLVLTSTAYAHVQDDVLYGADANAALRQRHLRVAVASSVDEATGLIGSSLSTADDEGAQLGKGSLAGHAPPSADAGHDNTKPPSRHDGSDNPKDHHLPKDDQKQNGPQKAASGNKHDGHPPPSKDNAHHHHHHDGSSSYMAGHDAHAGPVAAPSTPSQHHDNATGGNSHPGKVGKGTTDHQLHNPADVGYDGHKSAMDGRKDDAHHHHHQGVDVHAGKGVDHNTSKGGNLQHSSPSGAGSADAYLKKGVDVGSARTKK